MYSHFDSIDHPRHFHYIGKTNHIQNLFSFWLKPPAKVFQTTQNSLYPFPIKFFNKFSFSHKILIFKSSKMWNQILFLISALTTRGGWWKKHTFPLSPLQLFIQLYQLHTRTKGVGNNIYVVHSRIHFPQGRRSGYFACPGEDSVTYILTSSRTNFQFFLLPRTEIL